MPDSQNRSTDYSRDEELSVDQGLESENRNLSELFTDKGRHKKSKTRKRLATGVKVAND